MPLPEKNSASKKNTAGLKKALRKGLDMKKLSGKLSWKGNVVQAQQRLRINDQ